MEKLESINVEKIFCSNLSFKIVLESSQINKFLALYPVY